MSIVRGAAEGSWFWTKLCGCEIIGAGCSTFNGFAKEAGITVSAKNGNGDSEFSLGITGSDSKEQRRTVIEVAVVVGFDDVEGSVTIRSVKDKLFTIDGIDSLREIVDGKDDGSGGQGDSINFDKDCEKRLSNVLAEHSVSRRREFSRRGFVGRCGVFIMMEFSGKKHGMFKRSVRCADNSKLVVKEVLQTVQTNFPTDAIVPERNQRWQRFRKRRRETSSQSAARQHPGNHQTGDSSSGASWWCQAHLGSDLRGDTHGAQVVPRGCDS